MFKSDGPMSVLTVTFAVWSAPSLLVPSKKIAHVEVVGTNLVAFTLNVLTISEPVPFVKFPVEIVIEEPLPEPV